MKKLTMLLILILSISGVAILAQDEEKADAPAGMPPMGPPEEMKELAYLVGDWTATTKFKMDPDSDDWTDATATTSYQLVAGGACIQMSYTSTIMGMEFHGVSMLSYDREMKEWHETWIDNMGARISHMTGNHNDGKYTMTGEDQTNGMKFMNRGTTSEITENSFNWLMESSYDGGKTWSTIMSASYTKVK